MYSTLLCLALLPLVSSLFFAKQKCCPDGECYDLGAPWQSLTRPAPAPRCIKDPVKYLLTNRSNTVYPSVFISRNISKIRDYYNIQIPTVIVFHGWMGTESSSYMRNLTTVYLTRVDANAIFVDHGKAVFDLNYLQAVSDLRVAATDVIKMVRTLLTLGVKPSQIHLIGLSLGAHLAAYVAKAIPGIGRLTGLDPAGPLFTDQSCEVRFCKGDATFTEAIHANGNPLWGFGTSNGDADVDFWINGGWDQPNCGLVVDPLFFLKLSGAKGVDDVMDRIACSHGRALFYYTEAVASNCTIWGVRADLINLWASRLILGYPTKFIVPTEGCTLANCVPIGLEAINATGRGNFIVPTNNKQAFCENQQLHVSAFN